MTATVKDVPKVEQLLGPLLAVLRDLGGSGSVQEINDAVVERLKLRDDVASVSHLGSTTVTELGYRLNWAGTYLAKAAYLTKSGRGVWALTPEGRNTGALDGQELQRIVKAAGKRALATGPSPATGPQPGGPPSEIGDWKEQLLQRLGVLSPASFERLCQRMLRESGFTRVEVTGKTGDGGIDGFGVLRLAGLISFPILFQCKRYKGSVGAPIVRDFRGAMAGRADRGLLITTGTFTQDARAEASRDGAHPVDLVDGIQLAERIKELGLGVKTTESVEVDPAWFDSI